MVLDVSGFRKRLIREVNRLPIPREKQNDFVRAIHESDTVKNLMDIDQYFYTWKYNNERLNQAARTV